VARPLPTESLFGLDAGPQFVARSEPSAPFEDIEHVFVFAIEDLESMLVVEDNEFNQEVARGNLGDAGLTVDAAGDAHRGDDRQCQAGRPRIDAGLVSHCLRPGRRPSSPLHAQGATYGIPLPGEKRRASLRAALRVIYCLR
jgi:hypothetical protein